MSLRSARGWRIFSYVGVALLLASMLAGCRIFGDDDVAPASQATPAGDSAASMVGTPTMEIPGTGQIAGGAPGVETSSQPVRIVEGGLIEPRTLNPILVSDPISEELSHLVFNGLVMVDPSSGDPSGDLAESWTTSEDGLTYTFKLRSGVTWHDGQPFSARDAVFTYNLMMNERAGSPRYSRLVERISGVRASDLNTVVFDLIQPDASFLSTLATFGIVPEHALANVLPEEIIADPFGLSSAVGTGPFTLQSWSRGEQIDFARNPQYFKGLPATELYIYYVAPSAEALRGGLEDGTIDWGRLDPDVFEAAAEDDEFNVLSLPSYELSVVNLQLDSAESSIFLDSRVRAALMVALNRDELVEEVWHGDAQVANGVIPMSLWNSAASDVVYAYDPDEARRLLDEAGWVAGSAGVRERDGIPLSFALTTNGDNPTRRQIAEWLTQSWQEIGVEVRSDYGTWSAVRSKAIVAGEFEAVLIGLRYDLDPDQSAFWSSDSFFDGLNLGHYSNPEVDVRLESALATNDRDQRRQLYQEMQNLVMQDLPVLPLAFPNLVIGVSPRLQDVEFTAILVRNRANIEQWVPMTGK